MILQNVEVLAVAQEVEQKKDEPEIVKVVTLLVTPQESERLALASHSGTLRLAMRNYNDNKIVLTSGSDVAQMLRAYSLAPDVPVMAVQPEPRHVAVAPHRPKAVEIEILRNGKSSESVSFVNEAAADVDGSSKSAGHIRKAAVKADEDSDDDATDASADATGSTTVASAPAPDHHDLTSPIVVPASASNATANHVPTPKTIDIP